MLLERNRRSSAWPGGGWTPHCDSLVAAPDRALVLPALWHAAAANPGGRPFVLAARGLPWWWAFSRTSMTVAPGPTEADLLRDAHRELAALVGSVPELDGTEIVCVDRMLAGPARRMLETRRFSYVVVASDAERGPRRWYAEYLRAAAAEFCDAEISGRHAS